MDHDVRNCPDAINGCAECEALTCRDCGELKSDDPSTMVGDDLCGTCRDKNDNEE